MSIDALIRCPGCGRAYAPELFESGRVIDCACGARVGAEPIDRALPRGPQTRFFADAMLGRLARWLRVLGFDTAYEADIADAVLVHRALEQQRAVLTRDRRLPGEWRISGVHVLESDDTLVQLRDVLDRFDLWSHVRTFTRCTRCNEVLERVTQDEASHRAPPSVRARVSTFTRCSRCARVFWHGSHTTRVLGVLEQLRTTRPVARREVLGVALAATMSALVSRRIAVAAERDRQEEPPAESPAITMFLCGDVMTGRGIDQLLPHAGDPRLHEPYLRDARRYVKLGEAASGPIERPVSFEYIWGDALAELARSQPDARIINLETAVTDSDDAWTGKGIHYRMHPDNVPCLTAAGIDCCALANNHVLDWGHGGLAQTLETLERAGLKTAGAGRDRDEAETPAIIEAPKKGRVIVFSCGTATSGIPRDWAAGEDRGGVALIEKLSPPEVRRIAARVQALKRPGDVVIVSIHWGGNWGYEIPAKQRAFAHQLLDTAGVDVVHGHSSHHPKGIEVHRGKLILYGCGDFIDDYEGIEGYEAFRDELGFMYFASVSAANGTLVQLRLVPTRIRRFQVRRADPAEARWLLAMMNREGGKLGTRVEPDTDGALLLRWS